MPIFARRRLQGMVDELWPYLEESKGKSLLASLNSQRAKDVLAAEAELSMLWALSKVAHIEIEPELPNGKRPDAFCQDLFASAPAVIEITAVSDDHDSGQMAMERTANLISNFANSIFKNASDHLSFEFRDRYEKHPRERCVDPNFVLSPSIEDQLKRWIKADPKVRQNKIRIAEGKTDVEIAWSPHAAPGPGVRVFSRMPAVATSLRKNTIWRILERKSSQIKAAQPGTLRCVFLVDAGHFLLGFGLSGHGREYSGEEIIRGALQKLPIDVVCVFSPQWRLGGVLEPRRGKRSWQVTLIDRRLGQEKDEYVCLEALARLLPKPTLQASEARRVYQHDGIQDSWARGFFGSTQSWKDGGTQIKISSSLLQEYIAGRIDHDAFLRFAFSEDRNPFEQARENGQVIRGICLEDGGVDKDHDYIVFEFDTDPSLCAIRAPAERDEKNEANGAVTQRVKSPITHHRRSRNWRAVVQGWFTRRRVYWFTTTPDIPRLRKRKRGYKIRAGSLEEARMRLYRLAAARIWEFPRGFVLLLVKESGRLLEPFDLEQIRKVDDPQKQHETNPVEVWLSQK